MKIKYLWVIMFLVVGCVKQPIYKCPEIPKCPAPSDYCSEIDDICPATLLRMCELMKGEICKSDYIGIKIEDMKFKDYYCNEPSKYECESAHRVGDTYMKSINIKCSDGRIRIWDCELNDWE